METVNGWPSEENTGRRHGNMRRSDEQNSLGEFGGDSSLSGCGKSSRSTQDDSERTNTADWKLYAVRDTTAGKILERIESLESRHIKYVDAHESRLNARLEAARNEKEEFLREAHQIKSDLYHLVMAEKKADGNGHIN